MTRATGRARPSGVSCAVVVLDTAWLRLLPEIEKLVKRSARAAVAGARRSGRRTLNVALADDRFVQALNERHRAKDKPTNVLSYPSGEFRFLGDIVLARQTVWREASAQHKTPADHVCHLVVHGTLHLLGYDHEADGAEADRMEALERRVLKTMGIADPYEGQDAGG
jgi:probable rRNA maturation factor